MTASGIAGKAFGVLHTLRHLLTQERGADASAMVCTWSGSDETKRIPMLRDRPTVIDLSHRQHQGVRGISEKALVIRCGEGSVWLTIEGDVRDHILVRNELRTVPPDLEFTVQRLGSEAWISISESDSRVIAQ